MAAFQVLVVCVGNVCRSPLAERLLAARLPPGRFVVASAGVGALAGEPMDADAETELRERGGSSVGFRARQLTPVMVREAHLVLTATQALRSRVLEDSPEALRRTFTLRELAALLDELRPATPGDDLHDVVNMVARARSQAAGRDLDVADPFRRGPAAHAVAADEIDDAVMRIAQAFARG